MVKNLNNVVTLKLSRNDIAQMIDGLSIRRDSWRKTQRYLEGQKIDCIIEDCHNHEEASIIADEYERIINCIKKQVG